MADKLDTTQGPIPADASTVPSVEPLRELPEVPEKHHAMSQVLQQAIAEGKHEVPESPAPLVCKPRELESWRVFKIMSEFVEGFDLIKKYGLAASIFGTARQSFDDQVYKDAEELAGRLAKHGFAIITGGSAGIMEAANKGAYEAGGASIGLNIELPMEQHTNHYTTEAMSFDHFFVRKVMLTFASEVYIYFPGGFGTLDEFTEIATLVQTRKIRKVPIVLYGKEYWEPFTKIFEERLLKEYNAIDAADLDLYRVVDSVDEAFEYIVANVRC
ncbi:MAG TPA: TIGR00730 family Rossman fold protein [Candidatus Paceibacterota bacterium]|nr:TIGR00730 family Rossman fold protein [Candidatus Paceibacterota bacterium]